MASAKGGGELPTLWRPGFLEKAEGKTKTDKEWRWAKAKPIEAVVEAVRRADKARTPGEKVVIVKAQTASGKSTLIPPRIWKEFAMATPGGPGVVCTQPRRLTAIRLAQDVGGYGTNGVSLKRTLGWLTGVSAQIPPQKTSLLYATMGSVARALESAETFAEFAQRWRYVIVDEAHERSVAVDLFVMAMKQRLREHAAEKWCPVLVVMSATIDTQEYADYLGAPAEGVVEVAGRSYPIEESWPASDVENYTRAAAAKVLEAHEELPPTGAALGDVLVFLPGAQEHKAVKAELEAAARALAEAGKPTFVTLSVMGATVAEEGEDYKAVFAEMSTLPSLEGAAPVRRVILATAVAETGLTVDTLAAVVDCGWARAVVYLPNEDARGLVTAPASKRAVEQRMGRAGRMGPGKFYPLYAKATHALLPEAPQPEVLTAPPAGTLARIMRSRRGEAMRAGDVDLLSPLPAELVQAGFDVLYATGLATPVAGAEAPEQSEREDDESSRPGCSWALTAVGEHLSAALATDAQGMTAELITAVAGAHLWGAAPRDVLVAGAMAAAGVRPYGMPPKLWREVVPGALGKGAGDPEAVAAVLRTAMADENGEAVLLWAHFAKILEGASDRQARMRHTREAGEPPAREAEEWATQAGFPAEVMFRATGIYAQYADAVLRTGMPLENGAPTLAELAREGPRPFVAGLARFKRALEHGYRLNVAERDGGGYRAARGFRITAPRFPPLRRMPKYLLYLRAEITLQPDGSYAAAMVGASVLDGFTRGGPGAGGFGACAAAGLGGERGRAVAPQALEDFWELQAAARRANGDEPVPPYNHYKGLAPIDPLTYPTEAAGWYAREGDGAALAHASDAVVGGREKETAPAPAWSDLAADE